MNPPNSATPPVPRVTMFVRNTVYNDNRVLKEAAALAEAGYDVKIVGMQGPGLANDEPYLGARIIRVDANGTTRRKLLAGRDRRQAALDEALTNELAKTWAGKVNRTMFRIQNRLSWRLEPLTYMFDFDRAVAACEHELKADVWLAHDLNTLPMALRLRKKYGGAVVYDSHEYWRDCNNVYTPFAKVVWNVLERILIHEADQVITVSRSIARKLSEEYGVPEPAVVLNTPVYQAAKCGWDLRQKFSLSQKHVLVYVGLITHQRGYEQLITALRTLPDVAVVCFGHGNPEYIETLRRLAQDNGVAGQLVFAGSVPPTEIQQAIAGADGGIVAVQRGAISYDFALPSKLFEYVFAGLPVVAGDLVEIRNLVDVYGLGVCVDERDPGSLAQGIRTLVLAREKFTGPGWEEARSRFAAEYDWNNHKKVLVGLIDNLSGRTAGVALR